MLRKCFGFTVLLLFEIYGCVLPWVADSESLAPPPDDIADILTLELSIDYALKNSRAYHVAEKDVEIAAEKVKSARAALFPHLSLNSGYTFSGDLPKIVLEGGLPGLPPPPSADGEPEPLELELGSHHAIQGNLRLTYPLWTWGQVGNRYRQAVLGHRAAERALRAVELDIELKVRQAYYGVVLADAFVGVAEQSVEQVQKRYRLAEEQKATGVLTQLEVIRANVQVVNARSQHIQALNRRNLAEENLKLTLGLPLDEPVGIVGTLNSDFQRKSVNMRRAIATALKQRPELRQMNLQERIGETRLSIAKAGNKPMLSTFGNYTLNDSERQAFDTSWSVGVSVQIPIFDGFAHRAEVNQARLGLDQIRVNKAQLHDGIQLEVKSAVFDLQAAEKLIEAQEGIVEQAAEGLRIANVQYEAGLITGVELTDVELSNNQAQVNRLQAIYDYIIAVARVERAIGSRLE